MSDENEQWNIVMRVWHKVEHGSLTITGEFVRLMPDGKLRGMSEHEMNNLGVRAWADASASTDNARTYGWSFLYLNTCTVDLGEAERMVKVLRRIASKLERYRKDWGGATTFGTFVMRIAKVFNVTKFFVKTGDPEFGDREINGADIIGFVDHIVSQFHQEHGIRKVG